MTKDLEVNPDADLKQGPLPLKHRNGNVEALRFNLQDNY